MNATQTVACTIDTITQATYCIGTPPLPPTGASPLWVWAILGVALGTILARTARR